MRVPFILLLVAFAGCRGNDLPDPIDPARPDGSDFDAMAWVQQTRAEWDYNQFSPEDGEDHVAVDDSAWVARAREHALTLDAHTDWMAACDEAWGEPTGLEEGHFMRGRMYLEPISDREALIEVVCDFGAYQGTFVLVHVDGPHATVVRAPAVDPDAEGFVLRQDSTTAVFGGSAVFDRLASERLFASFARARGPGDCGEYVTYRLLEAGRSRADIVEVRARDCDGDPGGAPPLSAWPIVYPSGAQ